jgi:hypothetical protein
MHASQNSEYLACRPDFIFSDFDIQLAGKRSVKKKKTAHSSEDSMDQSA